MACSTQSALDYVTCARGHLVGELKNLSVIVESLSQQGVLCDEEVSTIQAKAGDNDKTKEMLDSVIKKGDSACYMFLKMIDITRNRILERPSTLSEKKTEASTKTNTFDLHQWISCFSFKDTQMDLNYYKGIWMQNFN